MKAPRRRRVLLALAITVVVGACGQGSQTVSDPVLAHVGRIPGLDSSGSVIVVNGVRANLSALQGPVLGTLAQGNKLLVIGDSIFAGTASRYGGAMCNELVPLGWRVAVEAEAGQTVTFGRTVLRDRIYEGWDAAVVFLGTNYGGSAEKYQRDLTAIVTSLAPRPTLLLTATVFKPQMADVNNVIRAVAAANSNVSVLDWGLTSTQSGLLNRDGIHPTDAGRNVLVKSVASALGTAPAAGGACLPSKYTDDTMGREFLPSTTVENESGAVTTTTPQSPATTTAQSPATTAAPSTSVAATTPPTTAAPSTTTTQR